MIIAVFVASASTLSPPQALAADALTTDADFCNRIQQLVVGTKLASRNVVHATYDAFKASKTSATPYSSHQYVMFEEGSSTRPMRVSCKFKTGDHLNAVYGAGSAAAKPKSCRDANRDTIMRVYRSFTPQQRAALPLPPTRILLDADELAYMGSKFIAPYQFAYRAGDGSVHVLARGLFVEWTDWRWKLAPDRFRGAHYCHLLAPEFAARLMRGEVTAPPQTP